jgi:hypothetical protein
VDPLGLYTLERTPRKVGEAYKKLISDWKTVLPTQSVCLTVPVAPLDGVPERAGRPVRALADAQEDEAPEGEESP